MSKFTEVSNETQKIFDQVIEAASIEHMMTIKILGSNRIKIIGKVCKATDIVKYMTDNDVIIVVNEHLFDMLDNIQQHMIADELVTAISYNNVTGDPIITKPDVITFSGIINKYGAEPLLRVHEIIRLAIQQEKDAVKEKKDKSKLKYGNIDAISELNKQLESTK
jgi:hypothetical protein